MFIVLMVPCTFANDGTVYENQKHKFSITIPNGWQTNEGNGPIVLIKTANFYPALAFFVEPMIDEITSSTITQITEDKFITPLIKRMLEDNPTMVLEDKRHLNIANYDVLQIVLKNDEKYVISYFFFSKNSFFMIPAVGLSNNLDIDQKTFDQILSTFKITN